MSCPWLAEAVFRPPCPAGAGDATSLRGVTLDETSVGDPEPGAVLQFNGSSYVTVVDLVLPGTLAYGGLAGGPQILTAENSGTFSGTGEHVVLTLTPADNSTIDVAFTLHTDDGSLGEVGIFRMYAAFKKVSNVVTLVGTVDATSAKLTAGAGTWTCDIRAASNRIEVVFTDPSSTGGRYSISAQYSVKVA